MSSLDDIEGKYEKLALQESTSFSSKLNPDSMSGYGTTELSKCPENHLRMSILAVLLCCPCGLVALAYALQVQKKYQRGDIDGAYRSSKKALNYSTTSIRMAFFYTIGLGLLAACGALFGMFYGIDSFRYSK